MLVATLALAVPLDGETLSVPGTPGPSSTVRLPWSFGDDQIQEVFSWARKNWLYGPPTKASLNATRNVTDTSSPDVETEDVAGYSVQREFPTGEPDPGVPAAT